MTHYNFKFVIEGFPQTGKSSLIYRYDYDRFLSNTADSGSSISYHVKYITRNKKKVKIDFVESHWERLTEEDFELFTSKSYQNTNVLIYCIDMTKFTSMDTEYIDMIITTVKKSSPNVIPIIMFTKTESDKVQIMPADITTFIIDIQEKLTLQSIDCFMTSAKNGTNVTDVFNILVDRLIEKEKLMNKKSKCVML